MKREMDRRMVYGGEDFVKDMAKTYNITEKIKQMGRQRGWRNNKGDNGAVEKVLVLSNQAANTTSNLFS